LRFRNICQVCHRFVLTAASLVGSIEAVLHSVTFAVLGHALGSSAAPGVRERGGEVVSMGRGRHFFVNIKEVNFILSPIDLF